MPDRRTELIRAIQDRAQPSSATRWPEVASDPNDAAALAMRSQVLRAAWRPPVADRAGCLTQRVAGKRILDIGAVAHDPSRMDTASWLHARLARAASSALAVDILQEGVDAMRRRGYDAMVHDLSTGSGPIAARGPFDVIVAGEIIEHLEDLGMLFAAAHDLLDRNGELILTTPNPYAPSRQWAGRRGMVWENVDHVMLAFPSGIAELASRHHLVLAEAFTVVPPGRAQSAREFAKRVRRRIGGTSSAAWGINSLGQVGVRRLRGGGRAGPGGPRRDWFVGETFVYVVRRPDGARA